MSIRRDRESALDNPQLTPPSTDLETGTWDDDGSIGGWRFLDEATDNEFDVVIEDRFEAHGCPCLLLRVTEYVVLGRHAGPERVGESETFYRGYVHAPDVESLPKGCFGTTIVDCGGQDGWFVWDERAWRNRCGSYAKSVREVARRKTERLAETARWEREGRL